MQSIQGLIEQSRQNKYHKFIDNQVQQIKQQIHQYNNLSDNELKTIVEEHQERISNQQETLDNALPDIYAIVYLILSRLYQIELYTEQLMGAVVLHYGNVAEMKTGEGKTLTATPATILNALNHKGVHVVTTNEYLAERDANDLEDLYNFFELTVGLNKASLTHNQKQEVFKQDIIYTTASEIGFDYLRDHMVTDTKQLVNSKNYHFAIIDEVDAILIDESKTPLLISQPGHQSSSQYLRANLFIEKLTHDDIIYDPETNTVTLSTSGVDKANAYYKVLSIYTEKNVSTVHYIQQALNAHFTKHQEIDYTVYNNSGTKQIALIDAFTGRLMPNRRYNNGLHQALEAKHHRDGVEIQPETKTVGTITLQNFFKVYDKLSGMSGTAKSEASEFYDNYDMNVIQIPTHRPVIRFDLIMNLYETKEQKWRAIVDKINQIHETGQPILVGTVSVEDSELLSSMLALKHVVLNAKQDLEEAEIIKTAGERNAITIATNMAGRGTDIKLGPNVKELGGLYVISTEMNDSDRIDMQLKGRSGRQGDPGYSITIASAEDTLFQRTDTVETLKRLLKGSHPTNLSNSLLRVLKDIQERKQDFSKRDRMQTLKYDNILNEQRDIYYQDRHRILYTDSLDKLLSYVSTYADLKQHYVDVNDLRKDILNILDRAWIKHIEESDKTKTGISYRAYNGANPLLVYQEEVTQLFKDAQEQIVKDIKALERKSSNES